MRELIPVSDDELRGMADSLRELTGMEPDLLCCSAGVFKCGPDGLPLKRVADAPEDWDADAVVMEPGFTKAQAMAVTPAVAVGRNPVNIAPQAGGQP